MVAVCATPRLPMASICSTPPLQNPHPDAAVTKSPLSRILARIVAAETQAGRLAGASTLIAVSKFQPPAQIETLLAQGHRVFGENRIQEAQAKWPPLIERHHDVALHLLGPLQTNKARAAMSLFDAIHTVDRLKLGQRLADLAQETGRCPDLFVQVNTGEEPQKAGVAPMEADRFIAALRGMDLPIAGMMCLPPANEAPAPHFALLARIAARNGLNRLSMGMSADFEQAIALGATHVRVGTALFGARSEGDI